MLFLNSLTKRELEMLILHLKGNSQADVAQKLIVSYHTVRTTFNHMYDKLGIADLGHKSMCVLWQTCITDILGDEAFDKIINTLEKRRATIKGRKTK